MKNTLKQMIALTLLLSISGIALAKDHCTDQTKEKWLSEQEMQARLKSEGYKIRSLKTTGTCYEIYGTDKNSKNLHLFLNPIDGSISQ